MAITNFNINPYVALKSLLEVTAPHLGENFLKITCKELKKLFEADLVFITEAMNSNPTTKVKILYATKDTLPETFEVEGTPCKLVYENKIIQITKDVNIIFEKDRKTNYKSFYGIPLHDDEELCIGHIAIFSEKERKIPNEIEDIANIFARRIEVEYQRNILEKENKRIRKELELMIVTDSLTKIYNRRHFNQTAKDILAQVKRKNISATLTYIDIDNFKIINDKYGHDTGDTVLIYLANTLKKHSREGIDFIFRVGGEEFAIISTSSTLEESINHMKRINKELQLDDENKLKITLSAGIELFTKNDLSYDDVYKKADKKMYEAKKCGKNCIK